MLEAKGCLFGTMYKNDLGGPLFLERISTIKLMRKILVSLGTGRASEIHFSKRLLISLFLRLLTDVNVA